MVCLSVSGAGPHQNMAAGWQRPGLGTERLAMSYGVLVFLSDWPETALPRRSWTNLCGACGGRLIAFGGDLPHLGSDEHLPPLVVYTRPCRCEATLDDRPLPACHGQTRSHDT